jgi:hypothetical protein
VGNLWITGGIGALSNDSNRLAGYGKIVKKVLTSEIADRRGSNVWPTRTGSRRQGSAGNARSKIDVQGGVGRRSENGLRCDWRIFDP